MQHIANSWEHLQTLLFSQTWDSGIERYRSPFIYRGLNHWQQDLATSLQRLGGPYDRLERHLLRNFRKYAFLDSAPGNSTWNWLALAQHHGLPTRLLDFTYSPYVALHFATNEIEAFDGDACIWALNYVEMNRHLPEKLQNVIRRESSNVFTAEMLDSVCKNLDELAELEREVYLIFLEPPSLDHRIINQYALFALLSSAEMRFETWLEQHPNVYFQIRIPAHLKWEIRDKLDQANITERVLFPGLGGLSMWLKRHYSPR